MNGWSDFAHSERIVRRRRRVRWVSALAWAAWVVFLGACVWVACGGGQ